MLNEADNELLCRVEPGTPMHETFKRYWLPAAMTADFAAPDSDPLRVTLLCQDYVLFRDSNGDMACLRDRCCHRGASLTLGRVEDCGVRCIFHGWQFAKDGRIIDMPNATDPAYKERYRQPAFPTFEGGGMVWVYLGPKEEQPPVPNYHWFDFPPGQAFLAPVVFHANYTQVLDGGADSSHLSILHQDAFRRAMPGSDNSARQRVLADAAPKFEVEESTFGQYSIAIRSEQDDSGKVQRTGRVSVFIAPSTVLVTGGPPRVGSWAIAVPVTSERTIFWLGFFNENYQGDDWVGAMRYTSTDPETLDRLGNSRETWHLPGKADVHNNWMQDREAMRRDGLFTGLQLFIPEDIAVAESMGAIYDRGEENLVPADQVIVRIRRILLDAARDVAAGRKPVGTREPIDTSKIVAFEVRLDEDEDWRDDVIPREFRSDMQPA